MNRHNRKEQPNAWQCIRASANTQHEIGNGAQTAQMLPVRSQTWSKWQREAAKRSHDASERSQDKSKICQDESKIAHRNFQTHPAGLKWSEDDSKSFPDGPKMVLIAARMAQRCFQKAPMLDPKEMKCEISNFQKNKKKVFPIFFFWLMQSNIQVFQSEKAQ